MDNRICGLIGRKLGHSFSPRIHKELGNPHYRLFELEPEELAGFFRRNAIGGLNVTIPYKRDAMAFCDSLSDRAREIGSVNTIVGTDKGLYGDNTDACGFAYMAGRANIEFRGKKVLVFGSGGASLTAQYVAKQQGAREVVVISRSGENNYQNMGRHKDAQILVNATPVGMFPKAGVSVADVSAFPRCEGVLDMVYNPRRTALVLQAESLGIPCSDGLAMLVAQAKAAAELFFDQMIPDSENERILWLIRAETENIVLIGMPGSGKTAVGAALSGLTGREMIDIDTKIEEAAGMTIPEIFEKQGEGAFRRMEREQTARYGAMSGKIIATGGGVVKDEGNYPLLRQNGRIYHILRDTSLLPREGRPLSLSADLEAMVRERLPLYRRFRDAAVENSGTPEETARQIWRDFCENTGD
jgi:shikimate dehydrogenase